MGLKQGAVYLNFLLEYLFSFLKIRDLLNTNTACKVRMKQRRKT